MIVITGAPRTGTTYIERYLNQDPNILILHECGHLVSGSSRLNFLENSDYFIDELKKKNISIKEISDNFNNLEEHFNNYVFGDKYPYYSMVLDKIPQDVKLILCVRNPFHSLQSMENKLGWSYSESFKVLLESYEGILRHKDSFDHIIIKYEDYVCNEQKLKRDLSNFLDVSLNIEDKVTESYIPPIVPTYIEKALLENSTIQSIMHQFNY